MKLEEAYNAAGRTETFILLESDVLDFDRKVKEVIRTEAEEGILLNEDVTIERLKNSSFNIEKLKTDLESLEGRLKIIKENYFLLLEQIQEDKQRFKTRQTEGEDANVPSANTN